MSTAPPAPLRVYSGVSRLLAPFAFRRTRRRLLAGGIPERRVKEREGHATLERPDGKLIWFHGASVGESLSILPLVEALIDRATVLVTSGTATSARLLADRLPNGALHQFAPIDSGPAVRRFLVHWRPDAGALVESELWPNLIAETRARAIPMALINARISDRSLSRWSRIPGTSRALLGSLQFIVAQDARTEAGLASLLPDRARLSLGGNMKPAAAPLPADPRALAIWRVRTGDRPVWVASSTHPGEDGPVLDAHAQVRRAFPDALLILIPRHPERGAEIAEMAREAGFATSRLGAGDPFAGETTVLVADTMGDLGLWYRIAPIVFLAGSWAEVGGHNPWEAIRLGAALLHGPNVPNAAQDYDELAHAGATCVVRDAGELADAVSRLLKEPQTLAAMHTAAQSASRGADALIADITVRMATLAGISK